MKSAEFIHVRYIGRPVMSSLEAAQAWFVQSSSQLDKRSHLSQRLSHRLSCYLLVDWCLQSCPTCWTTSVHLCNTQRWQRYSEEPLTNSVVKSSNPAHACWLPLRPCMGRSACKPEFRGSARFPLTGTLRGNSCR